MKMSFWRWSLFVFLFYHDFYSNSGCQQPHAGSQGWVQFSHAHVEMFALERSCCAHTQVRRMESLGHEVVPFEDVVCQMWDMLKLGDRSYVTLQVGYKSEDWSIFVVTCVKVCLVISMFSLCAPPCYCLGFTVVEGKRRHGDFRCRSSSALVVSLESRRLEIFSFRLEANMKGRTNYMVLRHDGMGSLRRCAFAGLPKAGGSEGGRRFL